MLADLVEDAARLSCPRTRAIACRNQRHLHRPVRQQNSKSTVNLVAGTRRAPWHGASLCAYRIRRSLALMLRHFAHTVSAVVSLSCCLTTRSEACCPLLRAMDCRNQEARSKIWYRMATQCHRLISKRAKKEVGRNIQGVFLDRHDGPDLAPCESRGDVEANARTLLTEPRGGHESEKRRAARS